MPAKFEVAFRDLLVTDGHSPDFAQRLIQRLSQSRLNLEEKTALIRLLMSYGYLQTALEAFIRWFEREEEFPFFEYLYLLHMGGFRPSKEFIDIIFKARGELGDAALSGFPRWTDTDSRFAEMHEQQFNGLKTQFEERKRTMLDKLEYLRLNRLLDEEEKLLEDLVQMYPDDANLRREKQLFRERWAREVILQKSFESIGAGMNINEPTFTRDELEVAGVIVRACEELAARNGKMAYNLALLLCFMELYEPALNILKHASPDPAVDWLYTEILLNARHFVECLDALTAIEGRYADDPETIFGVTYYRALALEGLGQLGTASELLRSIVSVRPSYRSAHSLLLKWAGGM